MPGERNPPFVQMFDWARKDPLLAFDGFGMRLDAIDVVLLIEIDNKGPRFRFGIEFLALSLGCFSHKSLMQRMCRHAFADFCLNKKRDGKYLRLGWINQKSFSKIC